MKKIFLLLGLCLYVSISSFAQDTYYIKGNAKILNPKYHLILKEDRNEYDPYYKIDIRIKDSVHTFTPEQVREYKHSTGKLYVRERLPKDGTEVFMEVVEDGYLRLYFVIDKNYQRRFFIKKENQLLEIIADGKSRSNFRRVLTKNWDLCKKTKKLIKIAEYNRPSLKRTVKAHNTCKEVYIPRFKFYVSGGIAIAKPELNYGTDVQSLAFEGVYRNFIYNFELSYTGAVGISIPIKQSNFSFETGLRAQAMKYNYKTIFSLNRPFDREFELELSLFDLAIPLDIQYTVPNIKYRPFFRAGLSTNFFLSKDADLLERILITSGGMTDQVNTSSESLKTAGIGINFALGFQQQLDKKNELFLTLGYHRRGSTPKNRIYTFSTLYVMMGYSF